jgi:hypothetical protein
LAVEMLGADLGGAGRLKHGEISGWFESGCWAMRSEARRARSWMAAAWASAVSPAQTWAGATTRSVDDLCGLIRTSPQTRHAVSERWG